MLPTGRSVYLTLGLGVPPPPHENPWSTAEFVDAAAFLDGVEMEISKKVHRIIYFLTSY